MQLGTNETPPARGLHASSTLTTFVLTIAKAEEEEDGQPSSQGHIRDGKIQGRWWSTMIHFQMAVEDMRRGGNGGRSGDHWR